jgi:hypothetical protein
MLDHSRLELSRRSRGPCCDLGWSLAFVSLIRSSKTEAGSSLDLEGRVRRGRLWREAIE